MKKSLLALALVGAFAGVAHAQSAVQIYGTVDAGLIKRTDQSLAIGKRANNTLGFRGTEELGSGLKALFQLEIRYEPDSGTIEQGAGGVQRPLFQGQSRVGLQGSFGMIRIGRGLTAFQETSTQFEPFRGVPSPSGFQTDLMIAGYTSDPLGLVGNSTNRFSNAVFYNSPEVNGFQVNTTIGTREGSQGSAAIIGTGTAANPQYRVGSDASANPYSVTATYKSGPGAIMLATERNAVETRLLSIAAYVMATPELKLMAAHTRQDQDHTRLINAETKAWLVGANYTIGANRFLAGYGQKSPDGLSKTKQVSLGLEHSLSKRTYLYFDISNKKGPTTPPSVNHYAIGVNHAF
ncbi:porin [Massilia cavernae]|uniref:Porin n=1 Tax=Massilia cavernae TaxID=2320864 RepID=A0A418XQE2_9BURK|nr:porin [Massilia cavernae]RJG14722.1 porin [Massilia cavernae]